MFEVINGYGYDLLTIKKAHIKACIEYAKEKGIKGIYLWDWKYSGEDVSFLEKCPFIKEINVNSRQIDCSNIFELIPELEYLTINKAKGITDLEGVMLKGLSCSTKDVINLEGLTDLEELYLYDCNTVTKDLEIISALSNLRRLEINGGNILSLAGIEKLEKLKSISIDGCRKLNSVSAISQNKESLGSVRISNCRCIKDYEQLGNLGGLRSLVLWNDGDIKSIQFVKNLHKLKHFVFTQTNIIDGNIAYCEGLEHVDFTNKKHYTHKNHDFNKTHDWWRS